MEGNMEVYKPKYGYVCTVAETKTNTGTLVLLAILSDGSPQLGHEHSVVLTLESFPPETEHEIVNAWAEQMELDQPWMVRY